MTWIVLNQVEDENKAFDRQKDFTEYFGLFANPEVYRQIKGIDVERDSGGPSGGFKIIRDTSAFDERMDKALRGVMVIHPQRHDVAEMVKRKRKELAEKEQLPDPRIRQYPTEEQYSDDLLVVHKGSEEDE